MIRHTKTIYTSAPGFHYAIQNVNQTRGGVDFLHPGRQFFRLVCPWQSTAAAGTACHTGWGQLVAHKPEGCPIRGGSARKCWCDVLLFTSCLAEIHYLYKLCNIFWRGNTNDVQPSTNSPPLFLFLCWSWNVLETPRFGERSNVIASLR